MHGYTHPSTCAGACLPAAAGELRTTGMLVVESVVPGSPADGTIEAGDVLVAVDGQVVTHFLTLEELLDGAMERVEAGRSSTGTAAQPVVELRLERGGRSVGGRAAGAAAATCCPGPSCVVHTSQWSRSSLMC
jgi:S1-C subfamily serine protease